MKKFDEIIKEKISKTEDILLKAAARKVLPSIERVIDNFMTQIDISKEDEKSKRKEAYFHILDILKKK